MSSDSEARPTRSRAARYRNSLWLLTKRDLRVRYSTNVLGYVWSVLDPLAMAAIYWFVFDVIFGRGDNIGAHPYIVFLLTGLLPWMWFNGSVSDSTRAFLRDAKLVRSTSIPRSIWVTRIVLSKGIEFVAALPVLAIFAIVFEATITIDAFLFPIAIVMQAALCVALGLIIAPLTVFFRDLERAVKLILRFLFYASPIVYSLNDLSRITGSDALEQFAAFNPLAGIFSIYRSAFFADQLNWYAVGVSAAMIALLLTIGVWIFSRSERLVLKEL